MDTCEEKIDSLLFEVLHLKRTPCLFGQIGLDSVQARIVPNFV